MKNRVQKWGNSLAVRIPKSFAGNLGLENNSPVEIRLEDGALVIKPDRDRQWDLDTILAGVTDENTHPEWDAEDTTAEEPQEAGGEGG